LLNGISVRFSSQLTNDPITPVAIPVPDTSDLPVFSDNVLPSMLVHLGIIELSHSTSSSLVEAFKSSKNINSLLDPAPTPSLDEIQARKRNIPREGPVLTEQDAYILRASAIDACDFIVQEARNATGQEWDWLRNLTLPELDAWLWAGAKDRPDYRELERFSLRNTLYF